MLKTLTPKSLGKYGENIATWYYQKLGYQIIGRNLYTRYGEIDLLISKNQQITIVEVKTRRNHNYGWGEEAVSETKIKHLILAYEILSKKNLWPKQYYIEICIIEIEAKSIKLKRLTP